MRWYNLYATGHFGYPQPEDGYAFAVYDTHGYCDRCGIHDTQCNPFRFRSEPKARHSQFLQLNWVFDEFFVRPDVESELSKAGITGIAFGPALHNKSGRILETVRQLIVLSRLPAALKTVDLQMVTCKPDNEEPEWHAGGQPRYPPDYPYCGRVKYHVPPVLALHRSAFAQAPDIVKSFEWFGSGGSAHRAVLASERAVDVIASNSWRGIKWTPVEFTD